MARLEGKVAVITGGASGIGKQTVKLFAAEGARLVIADVEDAAGRALAAEIGERAIFQHTDVAQESDVATALDLAAARFGRLDCVFNNAGIGGARGPIAKTSVADFDATLAVLLRGVFLGMKHAARLMLPNGAGAIISTASVAGLTAGYGPHIYSAAKAAVINLTRSVAMELAESGIRVNCICPGFIATPIFGKAAGLSAEQAEQSVGLVTAGAARAQPLGRVGQPEDVAQAALWLASADSSFVTGQALVVDGGLTSGQPWSASQARQRALADALRAHA